MSSQSVAEIVAETMNNYLLMGHLLKCQVSRFRHFFSLCLIFVSCPSSEECLANSRSSRKMKSMRNSGKEQTRSSERSQGHESRRPGTSA